MHFTARVATSAEVKTLKDDRQVVNFSVAQNKYFKSKATGEKVKKTEFIQCSYWLSTAVAGRITKGALVELTGFISINTYTTADGQPRANLTCHVDEITVHSKGSGQQQEETIATPKKKREKEDLPF